jgi:hypothetical protein
METITLNYEDYMTLLEGYTKAKSMELDLEYILNVADYDKYDKDVRVREDDLRIILKKYLKDKYDMKLVQLEHEFEKENE